MPVIKSAIKKLRRDIKKTAENDVVRNKLEQAIKKAKKQKTPQTVRDAISLVDRAVKKNLMHKNRAARIKSSLSKLARLDSTSSARQAKPITKAAKTATKKVTKSVSKTTAKKSPKKSAKSK